MLVCVKDVHKDVDTANPLSAETREGLGTELPSPVLLSKDGIPNGARQEDWRACEACGPQHPIRDRSTKVALCNAVCSHQHRRREEQCSDRLCEEYNTRSEFLHGDW